MQNANRLGFGMAFAAITRLANQVDRKAVARRANQANCIRSSSSPPRDSRKMAGPAEKTARILEDMSTGFEVLPAS